MNSEEIFNYSESFLNEIIENLIKLKTKKISSPQNNEFEIKLKTLMGKDQSPDQFKKLIELNDKDLKEKISQNFINNRKNKFRF